MACIQHIGLAVSVLLWFLQSFPTVAAQPDGEAAAIIKLVQESQKAGQEKHDLAKWLAPWAKDAKIITARSEKPGMYDHVLTWAKIKARAELRFSEPPPKDVTLTFAHAKVQVKGNEAVLRYQSTFKSPIILVTVEEIFLLRKTKSGWEIFESREWPVYEICDGMETKFDAKTWQDLDADVEQFRQQKNLLGQLAGLIIGYRFTEAHAVSKQLTQEQPQDPKSWLHRGYAAFSAADVKDALDSYRQALALDPKAEVPEYVRIALKKKG